jgi:IS30 family transposase
MRFYHQLTQIQRYQIFALRSHGHTYEEIAKAIRVHKSTVSREIARNVSYRGYRPLRAHAKALKRRCKPIYRISATLWLQVEALLRQEWSPEQVSGRLKREQGCSQRQTRGGNPVQAPAATPEASQTGRKLCDRRGKIPHTRSIDERPAIVNRRQRLGDWEVDTILGKRKGQALVTLTERKSRFTLVSLAERQTSAAVRTQICHLLLPLKDRVHTLTSDHGKEFAEHEEIARTLDLSFYFAHPYSAWGRGTNENTNGLLRQHFPKHSSFENVTEIQVKMAMDKLNHRPRKTLGFRTPYEVLFNKRVALTS